MGFLDFASRFDLVHAADGHPAKIHEGTCEALGPVAYSLNGVGASVNLAQTPVATPQVVNSKTAYQVVTSETTIPTPLAQLLSGDHARIARWRRLQALYMTWRRRPDLLATATLDADEKDWIERFERGETLPDGGRP